MPKHTIIIDMSPSAISPEVLNNADASLAALDSQIAFQEWVTTRAHKDLKELTEQRQAASLHLVFSPLRVRATGPQNANRKTMPVSQKLLLREGQ